MSVFSITTDQSCDPGARSLSRWRTGKKILSYKNLNLHCSNQNYNAKQSNTLFDGKWLTDFQ